MKIITIFLFFLIFVQSVYASNDSITVSTSYELTELQKKIDLIETDSLIIIFNNIKHYESNYCQIKFNSNFQYVFIQGNNSEIFGSMPETEKLNTVTGILQIISHSNLNLNISDLNIYYNATDYGILAGLLVMANNGTNNLTNIKTNGTSFFGIFVENSNGGIINNCTCNYNKTGGLGLRTCKKMIIENCEFSYNGCQTPVWGYGFALVNCFPLNENIIVRNCKALNNQRKGFDVHSGINILFEKNYVKGFEYAGIYAVSDGGGDRRAANITIRDNFIDGDTAHFKIRGIDIGSYGKNPDSCGYFIVDNNHIINTHNIMNSCAISVCNPDSGVAISSVTIKNNIIENGSANKKTGAINCLENDIYTKNILIENNKVHSEFSKYPINISSVEEAIIKNNNIYYSNKIRNKKGIKLKHVTNSTLIYNSVTIK